MRTLYRVAASWPLWYATDDTPRRARANCAIKRTVGRTVARIVRWKWNDPREGAGRD